MPGDANIGAAIMREMLAREAVASVSLSHPESCDCDVCKAAGGDEDALLRVRVALAEMEGEL